MSELTGLLLVDKPGGLTSHDVVGRVRYLLRTKKVGHAGTLDPLATGLLVLGIGRCTRMLGHLALDTKRYVTTVRFGQATSTEDAEGAVTAEQDTSHLCANTLDEQLRVFTGPIMQVPSAVSAIKVDGQRSYQRVRAGEHVALAARPVTITALTRTSPLRRQGLFTEVDLDLTCSSGTYVRALARDIGQQLGVGAHVRQLRRQTSGPFAVEDAVSVFSPGEPVRRARDGLRPPFPEELAASVVSHLIDPVQAARLAFTVEQLTAAETRAVRYGQSLARRGHQGVWAALSPEGDRLLALVRDGQDEARPVVVFDPAG